MIVPFDLIDYGGILRNSGIRLVGIDVDGTLVGSGGHIHPRVWETAQRACERGIHLALCSGRPAFGLALQFAKRLDVDGWHIFQNGASVLNLTDGSSRSAALPTEWVGKVINQSRSSGEVLELYGDTAYVVESQADWARQHADLLGVPFETHPFESLRQPVVRAQWLVSRDKARRISSQPHPGLEVARSGSPLMPDTQFVGLTREGVTKGSAIRSVAEEYGIPLRDVVYVGDSGNDISALQIVGHPVAMGNAEPEVIDAAKHRVGRVDDGGLAEALELAIDGG